MVTVEVLSDSTRRANLVEKRDAYFTLPSLKVLVFVEPDAAEVLVYRATPEGGFAMERHRGIDATVPLPEIDAALPLAGICDRVEFTG